MESVSPIRVDTEPSQPVNTEMKVSVPPVRLTIDLPKISPHSLQGRVRDDQTQDG